jgi:hypothetical protein
VVLGESEAGRERAGRSEIGGAAYDRGQTRADVLDLAHDLTPLEGF